MTIRRAVDFSVYTLFRLIAGIINLFPRNMSLGLGSVLGAVFFHAGRKRKTLVMNNLRRAFPDKKEEELHKIASSFYKKIGMTAIEFIRLKKDCPKDNVIFEGLENIETALKKGRGVVLLSAHFGNWELLGAALSLKGYKMNVVARPINNSYINEYVETTRALFGSRVIDKKNAVRKMLEVLKNNGILGILLDQRASRKEAAAVKFFGHPAPANKALALLAAKTGTPVLPIFIHRENLSDSHRIICSRPIELINTSNKENDIKENTQRFTDAIEDAVRKHPDEWFWFHSRWERKKRG